MTYMFKIDNGQWIIDNGQWIIDNGQWIMGDGIQNLEIRI